MKFENTQVFNIQGAMRGMRFPMQSIGDTHSEIIGAKDLDLAKRLYRASELDNLAHSKYLRQILVSVDITAPLYWYSEMDTYKVGTVANSSSTMHRLLRDIDSLSSDNFTYDEYLDYHFQNIIIPELKAISKDTTLTDIEKLRLLKQILPTSYNQKRHWTANYEVIRNIYNQRKNHRLVEWSGEKDSFCAWVKTLPYAEDLIVPDIKGREAN